jgi:uncharacterized protein with PIN domain
MGYDALLLRDADDGDLVRIALQENRVLLTKDARLLERRVITTGQVRAVLLQTDDAHSQLRQIVNEFHLNNKNSFSLCIFCNLPLEAMSREQAKLLVPAYVYTIHQEFVHCPACQRVYWKGTHWKSMRREMEQLQETE